MSGKCGTWLACQQIERSHLRCIGLVRPEGTRGGSVGGLAAEGRLAAMTPEKNCAGFETRIT